MPTNTSQLYIVLVLAFAGTTACASGSGTPSTASANSSAMIATSRPAVQAMTMEQAGEYLTIVGSCNDCHTQGWVEKKGNVAPADRFGYWMVIPAEAGRHVEPGPELDSRFRGNDKVRG